MTDFYRDVQALVIGGLGFIGSNLAVRLVELGARVTVVDSMIPSYGGNLFNIAPVKGALRTNFSDIRDEHSLSYLVRGQDVIFSLAGQVSHIDSMQDPITDLEINCRSQLMLLECCRKLNSSAKIVFASTRQLYGRPEYLPVDEDHPLKPVDVNGINKLSGELYYTLYHQVYGLNTVNLRLTNTYGPRMDLRNLQKGFAGVFVRKALLGETIEIYGDGQQRRDFNYVDDVIDALLLCGPPSAQIDGCTFNLGHHQHHSLNEFVAQLGELAEFDVCQIPFPPDRAAIDVGDFYASYDRFQKASGWSPKWDLSAGLAATISYFRQHLEAYL